MQTYLEGELHGGGCRALQAVMMMMMLMMRRDLVIVLIVCATGTEIVWPFDFRKMLRKLMLDD